MKNTIELDKKGLNVIRSQAAVGKSRYVIGEVGYKALKEGKNVLHVTLEQEVDRVYGVYVLKRILDVEGSLKEEDKVSANLTTEEYKEINETYIKKANKDFSKGGKELGDLAIVSPNIENFKGLVKKDIEKYLYKVYAKNHFDEIIVDPYYEGFESRAEVERVKELEDIANNFLGKGFVGVLVTQISEELNNTLLKKSKAKEDRESELIKRSNMVISLLKDEGVKKDREMVIHKQKGEKIERKRVTIDLGELRFIER